jgi:hypothetical protein
MTLLDDFPALVRHELRTQAHPAEVEEALDYLFGGVAVPEHQADLEREFARNHVLLRALLHRQHLVARALAVKQVSVAIPADREEEADYAS